MCGALVLWVVVVGVTGGDEAIREVLGATLLGDVVREVVEVGTVMEGLQFGMGSLGTFLDDGREVDEIVGVLGTFCETFPVFNRLSTTSKRTGEHVTVSCTPAPSTGYWAIESPGYLTGIKFPHTTSPPLLEYYILTEPPGGIRYTWPDYGPPTSTSPPTNITSLPWYPPSPLPTLSPTLTLPPTPGFWVTKPMCRTSTTTTYPTPHDTTACPRFMGVIGLTSPPTTLVKYLTALAATHALRIMVTTPAGIALATSQGYIQYPVNSTDAELLHMATLTQQGFSTGFAEQTAQRWVYSKQYTHTKVELADPLWVSVSATDTATSLPDVRRLVGSNIALEWQNMIKTGLAALGNVEQMFEEDNLGVTHENGRDVRITTQVMGYLVEVCKLYAGSLRAMHVTGPSGSFYYALCPVSVSQPGMKLAVRHVSQSELLHVYDYSADMPLKAYPDWGTATTQAYDPTTTAWFTSGLPATDPSLSTTITEPQALLLSGQGIILTKPRCSFNGVATQHDTAQCPRFQGLVSVEITNAQIETLVQGQGLGTNGYAFTVSPQGLVTDTFLKVTRTVLLLNGDYTARQTSGSISGDAYHIDIMDLVPVSGVVRVKSNGWKLVTLIYEPDMPVADLPTTRFTHLVRSVDVYLDGMLGEAAQSLHWLGASLEERKVRLTENSTVDAAVNAQMWSCEYFPGYADFFSSSPEGNLIRTNCSFLGGREVTVQSAPQGDQVSHTLDKHPGKRGTSIYVWDDYGPLAQSLAWEPSDEVWYTKAQASEQSTASQWTTYVPQVANPDARAPVVLTNVSTSVLSRPFCLDAQGRADYTATTCANLVGWLAGDIYLEVFDTKLKSFAAGVAYLTQDKKTLLAASVGPVTNATGALEVTNTSSSLVAELGRLREELGGSGEGVLGGRAVWVDVLPMKPDNGPATVYEDWELVMGVYKDQYEDDHVDTLRRLIKAQLGGEVTDALLGVRASLSLLSYSLNFTGATASTEGDTDRLLSIMWTACSTRNPVAGYIATSAEGTNMFTTACPLHTVEGVVGRTVTVKHAVKEYTYHMDGQPGIRWWWPDFGTPLGEREVVFTEEAWHREAVPVNNTGLAAKLMPPTPLEGLGQGMLMVAPRCGKHGQHSEYSLEGVCEYYQGLVGVHMPVTVLLNELFGKQVGLGEHGMVFAFTEGGVLLAASDGSSAQDILGEGVTPLIKQTAEELKIRQQWGRGTTAQRSAAAQQFDNERGTEMEIDGHTANVDMLSLSSTPSLEFSEQVYLCIVLRTSDFQVPLATRPPRRPLDYNSASTLAPISLGVFILLLLVV